MGNVGDNRCLKGGEKDTMISMNGMFNPSLSTSNAAGITTSGNEGLETNDVGFANMLVQTLQTNGDPSSIQEMSSINFSPEMLIGLIQDSSDELGADWNQIIEQLEALLAQSVDSSSDHSAELSPEFQQLIAAIALGLQEIVNTVQQNATEMKIANTESQSLQIQQLMELLAAWKQSGKTEGQSTQWFNTVQAALEQKQVLSKTSPLQNQVMNQGNEQTTNAKLVDQLLTAQLNSQKSEATQSAQQLLSKPVYSFHTLQESAPQVGSESSLNTVQTAPDQAGTMLNGMELSGNMRLQGTETVAKPVNISVPVNQFADEMNQFIVKSFKFNSVDGMSEAKLSLVPEQLGKVEVKLTMQNGQLIAQFSADTLAGKEALEAQLSHLRSTLHNQGFQVEKLEVTYQDMKDQTQSFQQQQHQQQFAEQQSRQHNNALTGSEESYAEFDEELEQVEYAQHWMKSSFEASA